MDPLANIQQFIADTTAVALQGVGGLVQQLLGALVPQQFSDLVQQLLGGLLR